MLNQKNKNNFKVIVICFLFVLGFGLAMIGTVWTASYLFHSGDVEVNEHIQTEEE